MSDHAPLSPDDPLEVAEALERHRPTLNALELDGLKRRVLHRSRTTITTSTKGTFMRSRTAITTLLASGLLLSGGGTALGVSALQATSDPVTAQYGGGTTTTTTTAPTLAGTTGVTTTPAPTPAPPAPPAAATPPATPPADTGDVADDTTARTAPPASTPDEGAVAGTSAGSDDPVQATRQVATISGDSLPFTGYASIPVLLLGMGLFAAGVVLRRRSVQL